MTKVSQTNKTNTKRSIESFVHLRKNFEIGFVCSKQYRCIESIFGDFALDANEMPGQNA
ncbi:hypothetical protein FLLO111716_02065 [Flavobacterium longum]